MKSKDLNFSQIPDSPGVYLFKAKEKAREGVLYIGKATSLKDRVRSYFSKDLRFARGIRVENMIAEADTVDWEETDSVLEALILEANLIKKLQPRANIREKDNKSFNWVVITKEDFPRILPVRGRELQLSFDPDDIKYQFGPYPHAGELKEALKIIRKIFPFRGAKDPVSKKKARQRSTLNEQIGLAPGFTTGDVGKKEYAKTVNHLRLFFEGKKGKLLKELEKEMKKAVKEDDFEKAAKIRNQIFALEHIRDVSLIKESVSHDRLNVEMTRIEGYDVAHMSGKSSAGVMVVVEGGEPVKTEYRKFKIREAKEGSDTDALVEVLDRRLSHDEWPLPKVFVIDGGKSQRNAAIKTIEGAGMSIPVVSVVKDEKHRPRQILGDKKVIKEHESAILVANAESHRFAQNYHKTLRNKRLFKK